MKCSKCSLEVEIGLICVHYDATDHSTHWVCNNCYSALIQSTPNFNQLLKGSEKVNNDQETTSPAQTDRINHPPHYTKFQPEVIQIIESYQLGYHLGNVIKYLLRAPYKSNELEDLRKARWYLDRYIETKPSGHKAPSEETANNNSGPKRVAD